jgi:hypothetical protein
VTNLDAPPHKRQDFYFLKIRIRVTVRHGSVFKSRQIHFPSSAIGRRKNLEKPKSTPRPLQPLEIPQNRQRNLWKNLEKKGLDLEMLGEKAWRFGAPTP